MGINRRPEEESMKYISKGPTFGKRHVQVILLFLAMTIEVMTRLCVSVSINAMTDNSTSTNPKIPAYHWTDTNVILSSFYWGYLVFQLMAGQIGKTYGTKWLLFVAMSINSLATTLIPLAAKCLGSKGVMTCRIIQGLSQGCFFPSYSTMLGRWAPKNERGRMSTVIFSGINLGSLVCLPITGFISQSYLGWPTTFYIFGGCGFLWSLLWLCFAYNSPATHPYITPEERAYIEMSLNQENDAQVIPTPWKEIFSSLPFWATVVPAVGSGYGMVFLQNEIPTYLEKVMGYNIASSGSLTSMSAGFGIVFGYIFGPLSDFVIEHGYLTRVNTRKAFEIFAYFGSAASLLTLAYLDESQAGLSIVILTLASIFGSGVLFGDGINPVDLSPRFSGVIIGFSNSITCLAALFAPLSVHFIVSDETNAQQWRQVFIIAALSFIVPSLFFILFASGERQWWDDGANAKRSSRTTENQQIVNGVDHYCSIENYK